LNEVRSSLTYLITINRQGRLHFYEYSLSGRRLISTTLYNLEELLFKSDKKMSISKSNIDESVDKNLPLIYQHKPFPISFPTPSIRYTQSNTFQFSDGAIAAVTNDLRILFWMRKGFGAKELLNNLSDQSQYEITYSEETVFVLEIKINRGSNVSPGFRRSLGKLYAFDLRDDTRNYEIDLSERKIFISMIKGKFDRFYGVADNERNLFYIDGQSGEVVPHNESMSYVRSKVDFSKMKKWVNNGYTTIKKAKGLGLIFDEDGFPTGLRLNWYVF